MGSLDYLAALALELQAHWYRNWPTFSRELTAAITEAHP